MYLGVKKSQGLYEGQGMRLVNCMGPERAVTNMSCLLPALVKSGLCGACGMWQHGEGGKKDTK